MRIIVFAFALFYSVAGFSTIEITSVSGVSAYTPGTTSVSIYGGLNNNDTLVSNNGDDTYVTCDGTVTACNSKAVVSGTTIKISFKSSSVGTAVLLDNDGNVVASLSYPTADATLTFPVTWGDICPKTSNSNLTNCSPGTTLDTENGTATMSFGISTSDPTSSVEDSISIAFELSTLNDLASTNGEGIEDYSVFPGDNKIYIETISAFNNNFTQLNPAITSIQVFFIKNEYNVPPFVCTASYGSIVNNSDSVVVGIDADGFLANEYIEHINIQNEIAGKSQEYTLRIASVDSAGNIGLFSDPNGDNASCTQYTHSAVPQPVYGLLADGSNCFIATAAYGSILDDKVQVFRDFRDKFLMHVRWGQKFIKFYYANSPHYANIIAQNKFLRTSAQAALFPLLIFSQLMLAVGPLFTFMILLSLVGFILLVRSHGRGTHAQ